MGITFSDSFLHLFVSIDAEGNQTKETTEEASDDDSEKLKQIWDSNSQQQQDHTSYHNIIITPQTSQNRISSLIYVETTAGTGMIRLVT